MGLLGLWIPTIVVRKCLTLEDRMALIRGDCPFTEEEAFVLGCVAAVGGRRDVLILRAPLWS